jgi:hypothetical protein
MIIYSRLCIGIRPFSPRLLHSLFSSSSNQTPIAQPSYLNVPIGDLKNHLTQILKNQGHDSHSSNVITDTILYAELRNNNQGIVKVIAGALKPNPAAGDISTVFETPVSCQIDGNQQIGMVVVKKCTDIAIQKAKISGVCIVGCSNYSSATGALGVWARQIFMCMNVFIHTFLYLYVYIGIYIYMCMYVYIHMYVYIYTYVCIFMYIRIHTFITQGNVSEWPHKYSDVPVS